MTRRTFTTPEVIGWRETVALPKFGIRRMNAKIDTGARTSALHAVEQERFERDGEAWVRFRIPLPGKDGKCMVEAQVADEREVKNTGGIPERRLIVSTILLLGRHRWRIEASLADRAKMEFDMILGRTAIRRRGILVDCGRSWLTSLPENTLKKKRKDET